MMIWIVDSRTRWLTTEMRLEFKIPRIPIFMATAS
jgi:hypothetical protein